MSQHISIGQPNMNDLLQLYRTMPCLVEDRWHSRCTAVDTSTFNHVLTNAWVLSSSWHKKSGLEERQLW